jgi:hypothetical protein
VTWFVPLDRFELFSKRGDSLQRITLKSGEEFFIGPPDDNPRALRARWRFGGIRHPRQLSLPRRQGAGLWGQWQVAVGGNRALRGTRVGGGALRKHEFDLNSEDFISDACLNPTAI